MDEPINPDGGDDHSYDHRCLTPLPSQQERKRPNKITLFLNRQRPSVAKGITRIALQGMVAVGYVKKRTPRVAPANSLMGTNEQDDYDDPVDVERWEIRRTRRL